MIQYSQSEGAVVVSIHCLVYNHGPYIRKCLEGFIMQNTNFRFEAIVHDDASMDESASIIKGFSERYPEIIKPIFETENQWSKGDGVLANIMFKHMKGKYIAYCEGDDYWTDPLKLQKQVDVLEASPDVSMVYTGFCTVNPDGSPKISPNHEYIKKHAPSGDVFGKFMERNYMMTLTLCLRKCVLKETYINSPYKYDLTLALELSLRGKVAYLADETGCYRRLPTGMMSSKSEKVSKEVGEVCKYYALLFLDGYGIKRSFISSLVVKFHILRHFFYDKEFLSTLIFKDKSLKAILFFFVWPQNLFYRIKYHLMDLLK